MSGLQDNDQARAVTFLDRCGVEWRPGQLGLERETLERIILGLPTFVREAGLPHSIIDEAVIDSTAVSQLIDSIRPSRHLDRDTPPRQEDRR
jgi:hypothetical protein